MNILTQSDPVSRLWAAIILALGSAAAHSWAGWMAVAVVTGIYYYFSAVNWRACRRYLRPALLFCAITVILGQGAGGVSLIAVGSWEYTTADAVAGVRAAVRIFALLGAVAWFSASVEPADMANALAKLLRPLRHIGLHTDDIGTAMFLALRFLPLTISEARHLRLAQEARAVSLATGGRALWQRFTGLTIPLLASVLRRSDAMAATLVLRGYRRGQAWQQVSDLDAPRRGFSQWDALAVAPALLAVCAALFM